MKHDRVAFFNPDYCTQASAGGVLVVREAAEDGEAEIEFAIPPESQGLAFRLSGDKGFNFLASRSNADGHLLIQTATGAWSAYVIECKKTLTASQWGKAIRQFKAGTVRLQFVADFLGITIAKWYACVAYREDKLSPERTPNPVLLKGIVGKAGNTGGAGSDLLAESRQWKECVIQDVPFAGTAPLRHIRLDNGGRMRLSLHDGDCRDPAGAVPHVTGIDPEGIQTTPR